MITNKLPKVKSTKFWQRWDAKGIAHKNHGGYHIPDTDTPQLTGLAKAGVKKAIAVLTLNGDQMHNYTEGELYDAVKQYGAIAAAIINAGGNVE